MKGGEDYIRPGIISLPFPSQSAHIDGNVHLPTVSQIWREGNKQEGND